MRRLALVVLAIATASSWGLASAASLDVDSARMGAWSEEATCDPATVTLSPAVDATVDQSAPNTTLGATGTLLVRSPLLSALGVDLGGRARALLRFDLPEPELCSVTSAKLRMNATTAVGGRTLEAVRLSGAWTEGAVTWNNQPGTTGAVATATSGSGWREWTVTSLVQAMYAGTNNGLLVRDVTGVALLAPEQVFASRTAASLQPELVVELG